MAYYRSRAGEEGVGHSLLGLLMAALGVALGLAIAVSVGVELPDPRQVAYSVGLGQPEPREAPAGAAGAALPSDEAVGEQLAPFCGPGEEPKFVLGFAELKQRLGPEMGDPVECEHHNPENGDALQLTTNGLAYYRQATNTAAFTDGWRHWALTADGLVYWEGESADPPPTAERLDR